MDVASNNTTPTPPTIGMRLDSMLDQMENLSSTQLYGLIVAMTVALCLFLLGTGHQDLEGLTLSSSSSSSSSSEKKHVPQGKEPRWHIFKYVNVLFGSGFVASVATFLLNASQYMESQGVLIKFLIVWSMFLCYFFGFFGVSLVHQDLSEETVQQKQQPKQQPVASAPKEQPSPPPKAKATKVLHKPAACTPVCSDPSSFQKASSSSKVLSNLKDLPDQEIADLVLNNQLKDHQLEKLLDPFRAVDVRRIACNQKLSSVVGNDRVLETLPSNPSLDYSRVYGANCEIVVGYVPLPVGLVGPLTLNNETVYVPMATTEGCLVASTNRGAKAISQSLNGAQARIVRDGITRAPCVRMASAMEAADLKVWCETPCNFAKLKAAFESTTSFGKLRECRPTVAGKNVYLRLVCFAGDAMGMNMVSKGSLAVIELLQEQFPSLQLVALSGNMCTDKKAAATNWLEGRGKSVVVEATIPQKVVRSTLKTTVPALVHTNTHKNLIGSAMAGSLGGFNAHASNIVTAVFLATGQDPAQNVESSNCITLMEEDANGDLWMSCTMPSIEVGTVGGGTSLEAQSTCLQAIGCKGGGATPGENAQKLATVVAAATMAGELSLLSALAANTLVQAHMTHNRKPAAKKST